MILAKYGYMALTKSCCAVLKVSGRIWGLRRISAELVQTAQNFAIFWIFVAPWIAPGPIGLDVWFTKSGRLPGARGRWVHIHNGGRILTVEAQSARRDTKTSRKAREKSGAPCAVVPGPPRRRL